MRRISAAERWRRWVRAPNAGKRWCAGFVLNAEDNVEVDLTALDAVEQLRAELSGKGIVFAMARVEHDLREALDASGLTSRIGERHLYPTLSTAVAAFCEDRNTGSDGPSGG